MALQYLLSIELSIESGRVLHKRGLRNPTIEVGHALALALDTTLSDLIRRAERRLSKT